MSQIVNFSDINQESAEGKYLLAAIDILSHQENIHHQGVVHIGSNMTNEDLLEVIGKRASAMFPGSQEEVQVTTGPNEEMPPPISEEELLALFPEVTNTPETPIETNTDGQEETGVNTQAVEGEESHE